MRTPTAASSVVAVLLGAAITVTMPASSDAAAPARAGKECNKHGDSLVVNAMTCKEAKKVLAGALNLANRYADQGRYTFSYQGFRCRLPYEDTFNMTCVASKPKKRSFVYEAD